MDVADEITKSKRKWTDEEVEKLIDLFEARPVLWDRHAVDYFEREKREIFSSTIQIFDC